MSSKEFDLWIAFNEHSPLNTLEIQLAQLSTLVNLGLGGKASFEDFYPGRNYEKEEAEEISGTALNSLIKGMF